MTGKNVKEAILMAAREAAMAYGYSGINFREIADVVGIKAASINYHFANKAVLAEAVAKRYWEDIVRDLDALSAGSAGPLDALHRYPTIFRASLERENRICLSSFMAAEYDEIPQAVLREVQTFADVNVTWISSRLRDGGVTSPAESENRAQAIYAAIAGAQIVARSRSDVGLFDLLVENYRKAGLLPP